MNLIWATRGHTWGFRFLRDGNLADPLAEYERMFSTTAPQTPPLRRMKSKVAVRLDDPDGRRDRSGRLIEHDFIIDGDLANQVHSLDDARRHVWPLVRDEYAAIWDLPDPDQQRSPPKPAGMHPLRSPCPPTVTVPSGRSPDALSTVTRARQATPPGRDESRRRRSP